MMDSSIYPLTKYLAREGPVLLLESQSEEHCWSRKSFLAARPKAMIKAYGDTISREEAAGTSKVTGNPWEELRKFRKAHGDWLFGYLGYDLKNHVEKLGSQNSDGVQAPDLFFMVPQLLIEFDHQNNTTTVVRGELPPASALPRAAEGREFKLRGLRPRLSQARYVDKIRQAQSRIAEGDFYEINLSHQLRGRYKGKPLTLYKRMKEIGPVPFGAYLQTKKVTVCCQSPERFLRKEQRKVFSQPIKGTSQRGRDEGEDELLKQQLLSSKKEQAENLMIVDLVRNDLSKIARQGSVNVPKLFDIESFGTVHQMVSTIEAKAEERDPVVILRACFPMGSMTGAPKISAMKSIEELEEYRRGIYSGAVGYIKPNGNFDFNVVIRTAILTSGQLFYAVGGAITADSNPRKEWQETLVKAEALKRAVDPRKED